MVIALLVMSLLALFTAATLSRITSESLVMANDYSHAQAFYAAHSSLEKMSRNFGVLFQTTTVPTQTDINRLQASNPNDSNDDALIDSGDDHAYPRYAFQQVVTPIGNQQPFTINDPTSPFDGLYSLRSGWKLDATATTPSGVQARLTRSFYNHLIPLFQFGVFYDGDMEFAPTPVMYVGGRVHTNGHLFVGGNSGTYFEGRVTASGEIVREVQRSGISADTAFNTNFTTNGGTTFKRLTQGSVAKGPDTTTSDPDMPNGTLNSGWASFQSTFNGWLKARERRLQLPLQVGTGADPIEIIKPARSDDTVLLADSRFFNKSCVRVSLADSQSRLPGGTGGVRLDGNADGGGAQTTTSRGYQPRAMLDGYQAVRFNGHRLYTGASYVTDPSGAVLPANRQTWIKVERVTFNPLDSASPLDVTDITEDILSLGMTDSSVFPTDSSATSSASVWIGDGSWSGASGTPNYRKAAWTSSATADPSRAIIKMQRFAVEGPPLKVDDIYSSSASVRSTTLAQLNGSLPGIPASDPRGTGATSLYRYVTTTNGPITLPYSCVTNLDAHVSTGEIDFPSSATTSSDLYVGASTATGVVPFPIRMYDVREGLYFNDLTATEWNPRYRFTSSSTPTTMDTVSNSNVPRCGAMSLIDIDMSNLARLLSGTWDGQFPVYSTLGADIKNNCDFMGRGVIVYVSDRRGDYDNDGIYDMENIYVAKDETDTTPPTENAMQTAEDVGGTGIGRVVPDGLLQMDYTWESARYYTSPLNVSAVVPSDVAALFDQKQYRRAVRIVNAQSLSNTYLTNTKGLTIVAEQGIYTLGNVNSSGITASPSGGRPTAPANYAGVQIPMAIIGDAITVLSREWTDGKSFRRPIHVGVDSDSSRSSRTMSSTGGMETTIRAAMMTGNSRASHYKTSSFPTIPVSTGTPTEPYNGGTQQNVDGGVHVYPRMLERWGNNSTNARLNICGSLICLWHSRNNNGSYKFPSRTYTAPDRNWAFDTSFQFATRLPPGTPMLQYVEMTGFREVLR
jgi:hypothetical protein